MLEVSRVSRNHDQISGQGNGCDLEVRLARRPTLSLQFGPEATIHPGRSLVEWKDRDVWPDALIEQHQEMLCTNAPVRAVEKFAYGDGRRMLMLWRDTGETP